MSYFILAALLQASPIAADTNSYAAARRECVESGKPMVVMVSTEWCVPCQTMKRRILPQIRKRGLFKKVSFTVVNPDHNGPLAKKLTGGGPVPQLVMYRKTLVGWKRRKLVGGQSVESVEKFINEGVALNEESNKATPEQEAPKDQQPPDDAEKASVHQVSSRQE